MSGVKVPHPLERAVTPDEQRIITFLEFGVEGAEEKLRSAVASCKFATAADAQHISILLQTVIDAIRAGLHDEGHPERIIDPRAQSRLHLAGIGDTP